MDHGRRDHYAVLGVARTATRAQVRTAYRRLAQAFHPDRNPADATAERRFKRVARAYEVLGDARRRAAYDQRLARGRFAAPGTGGRASYAVDHGPVYHSDLGHHSDFYSTGDPLTVAEAAVLTGRHPDWLRAAIRSGRLRATWDPAGYLLRRRDVERLHRTAARRRRALSRPADEAGA